MLLPVVRNVCTVFKMFQCRRSSTNKSNSRGAFRTLPKTWCLNTVKYYKRLCHYFKNIEEMQLVIEHSTRQNNPQPVKTTHNQPKPLTTTQNHQQLPKTIHNQMVWNFHISGRKIFASLFLILQFPENNLRNWLRYF